MILDPEKNPKGFLTAFGIFFVMFVSGMIYWNIISGGFEVPEHRIIQKQIEEKG